MLILTHVFNDYPFITWHLPVLNRLPFDWHWHIMEGALENQSGNGVSGLSRDGTTEYLNSLAFHRRISIHRRMSWKNLAAALNEPLSKVIVPGLLMWLRPDESWSAEMITKVFDIFNCDKELGVARFRFHQYFGPHLYATKPVFPGEPNGETRFWRFSKGDEFVPTEPVCFMQQHPGRELTEDETARMGLVIDQCRNSLLTASDCVVHRWHDMQRIIENELLFQWVPGANITAKVHPITAGNTQTQPKYAIIWVTDEKYDSLTRNSMASAERRVPFGFKPVLIRTKRHEWRMGRFQMYEEFQKTGAEIGMYLDSDTAFVTAPPALEQLLGGGILAMGLDVPKTIGIAASEDPSNNPGASLEELRETRAMCGEDFPFYNAGVILFRRDERIRELMQVWHEEWQKYRGRDQFALARALARLKLPVVKLDAAFNFLLPHIVDNLQGIVIAHAYAASKDRIPVLSRESILRGLNLWHLNDKVEDKSR